MKTPLKYNSGNSLIWILFYNYLYYKKGKYSILKKPSKQVTFKLKKHVNFLPKGSQSCNSLMEFFTMYFLLNRNPYCLRNADSTTSSTPVAAEKHYIY